MTDRPTVALFDIDGTLLSCGGAGRAAMVAAFGEICGAMEPPHFPFGGGTDRAIARRYLTEAGRADDDASIEGFLACYLRHLPDALERSTGYRVLEGAHALLDRLEHRPRFAAGLGTGNVEAGAFAKLERGRLDHRFEFGGFGSDHEERPRLIAAGADRGAARLGLPRAECRVVVIGDTERDVHAARAIGAECLAVTTGSAPAEALRAAGADHVFDGLHDPGLFPALVG